METPPPGKVNFVFGHGGVLSRFGKRENAAAGINYAETNMAGIMIFKHGEGDIKPVGQWNLGHLMIGISFHKDTSLEVKTHWMLRIS